eukprot:5155275-Lingulodinium_polyedra.AAC.1
MGSTSSFSSLNLSVPLACCEDRTAKAVVHECVKRITPRGRCTWKAGSKEEALRSRHQSAEG